MAMKNDNFIFDEAKLADMLRNEILKESQPSKVFQRTPVFKDLELISTVKNKEAEIEEIPYVSPLFSMSEDEILAFVEEFEVGELATLSVEELNHIGHVLGVEPKILFGMSD